MYEHEGLVTRCGGRPRLCQDMKGQEGQVKSNWFSLDNAKEGCKGVLTSGELGGGGVRVRREYRRPGTMLQVKVAGFSQGAEDRIYTNPSV